jgi:hypothetical protein
VPALKHDKYCDARYRIPQINSVLHAEGYRLCVPSMAYTRVCQHKEKQIDVPMVMTPYAKRIITQMAKCIIAVDVKEASHSAIQQEAMDKAHVSGMLSDVDPPDGAPSEVLQNLQLKQPTDPASAASVGQDFH